jgi:hypothetical protein
MPSFRITYHTTGGPFSRTIEAESAEAAEQSGLSALDGGATLSFTEKDTRFTLKTAQVAAISVQEDKSKAADGERRMAGFLAR